MIGYLVPFESHQLDPHFGDKGRYLVAQLACGFSLRT
jgi:hypothetical protein